MQCITCGYTADVALGHSWTDATCTSPKTCSACGVTSGTALGHSWTVGTCTSPKTCLVCGTTSGEALGHTYVDGVCTICGDQINQTGVTISGIVTSYLEGDVTVELIQDGEVVHSATVSGGEYAIEGVVAGEYTLRISKANHAPVEIAITIGEEDATFDATIYPIGDVTRDGVVNIKDFQRLLRHVNKTSPLEGYALSCGDVTGDGVCNIKDFQRLLRHVNKTNPLF